MALSRRSTISPTRVSFPCFGTAAPNRKAPKIRLTPILSVVQADTSVPTTTTASVLSDNAPREWSRSKRRLSRGRTMSRTTATKPANSRIIRGGPTLPGSDDSDYDGEDGPGEDVVHGGASEGERPEFGAEQPPFAEHSGQHRERRHRHGGADEQGERQQLHLVAAYDAEAIVEKQGEGQTEPKGSTTEDNETVAATRRRPRDEARGRPRGRR